MDNVDKERPIYQVIDPNNNVIRVCKTRRAAMLIADKLDLEYGATIHRVKEVTNG